MRNRAKPHTVTIAAVQIRKFTYLAKGG